MTTNKQYDYGLAILRALMCFMVVLCHFFDSHNVNGILKIFVFISGYAVPVFMIMSFYFSKNTFEMHEKIKVRERFERLIIPQIGWAVIYWIIYYAIDCICGTSIEHGISDVFWQIFTGHSPNLNETMWYQVDLIWITTFFMILSSLYPMKYKLFLGIIGVLALLFQYTGANMIFGSLRHELKYPLGRFAEMIPLAVVGFYGAKINYLKIVKKHRLYSIIFSAILAIIAIAFFKYAEPQGYGYQGLKEIFMGVALITFFGAIPFEKINVSSLHIIRIITRYTLGIYCMHRLIGTLMNMAISNVSSRLIKMNSFIECIIIYIFCYLLCMFGAKMCKKTKFNNLFE